MYDVHMGLFCIYGVYVYLYVYNKTTLEGFCFDANNFLVYDASARAFAHQHQKLL